LITTRPATATATIRLPKAFASAWSPGFDLHVTGEGDTPADAKHALVAHLRELAAQLLDEAVQIDQEESLF
jgi:hypothetical protein